MIPKVYKVIMVDQQISIDPEELTKVLQASASGSVVVLKQGIINNPNMIAGIVEDKERRSRFLEDIKYEEPDSPRRQRGIPALEDIFGQIEEIQKLKRGEDNLLAGGK